LQKKVRRPATWSLTDRDFSFRPVLRSVFHLTGDPRFWAIQLLVVATAVVHNLLEAPNTMRSDLADFLPVSFLWIPLIYAAMRFGLAGSIATSAVVIVSSLPNWLYFQSPETLPQEISLVVIAASIALVIGRQVDRRSDAQERAKVYAAAAARRQEYDQQQLSLLLHDDAVQTLISACYRIDAMTSRQSQAETDLADLRAEITGVVESLRNIAVDLRPPILDDKGLPSAVQALLNNTAKRRGFESQFSVSGTQLPLPMDTEIALFRIAQEALRNVEKHARANHVQVSVAFTDHTVTLDILDDGVGFDASSRRNGRSGDRLGLVSMKERTEMQGGRLKISSGPGKGTKITATIPIGEK
jgi:signal transduction histidine kinase